MASDNPHHPGKPPMTVPELIGYVKQQLDAEDDRQAKVSAASAGELPRASQPPGSTVDLSHKNVHELPVEIITLIKARVERLALSHNARIVLPVEILQCDRLRYLNLRWNKLSSFPDAVLGLPKLEILDISKNSIESIPEEIKKMTNLKFLAVARNHIKRLPLAIGEMNLVKLKFDENPIEFPPLDALKLINARMPAFIEPDKDKEVCQQVKRFMKAAALRERQLAHSEAETSESNAETPRPPRRGVTGGRFPVRPSISGMEHFNHESKGESPSENPPPIPERSHARGASSTAPSSRRPSLAPVETNVNESGRGWNESGSVPATKVNSRRQGIVPRRNTNLGPVKEHSTIDSEWAAFASLVSTPSHSRATSLASNSFSDAPVGISTEPPSATASPADRPASRPHVSRRLSRQAPKPCTTPMPLSKHLLAIKRIHALLSYLIQPMSDVARHASQDSPARSVLHRHLTSARNHIEELGRLIENVQHASDENSNVDPALLTAVVRTAVMALDMHGHVVRELNRTRQHTLRTVDAFYTRSLMNQSYSTAVEARNICHLLGFGSNAKPLPSADRASITWSSRTVTPTYARPALTSRRRGTFALASPNTALDNPNFPPQPHMSNGRSNTVNSKTPNGGGGDAYPGMGTTPSGQRLPLRSNPVRGAPKGNSNGEAIDDSLIEYAYTKLKDCFTLASQILPQARVALSAKKAHASATGHAQTERQCNTALVKCEAVTLACTRSQARLRNMRVGELSRHQRDFTLMCEQFTKDWAEFASEIVPFRAHADIGTLRQDLRPIHAAVKEARGAVASLQTLTQRTLSNPNQPHPWPPAINTNLASAYPPLLNNNPSSSSTASSSILTNSGTPSIPSSSMPATPLTAALGPAAQAALTTPATSTTSSTTTPTSTFNSPPPAEYISNLPPNLPPLPPTPLLFPPLMSYPPHIAVNGSGGSGPVPAPLRSATLPPALFLSHDRNETGHVQSASYSRR